MNTDAIFQRFEHNLVSMLDALPAEINIKTKGFIPGTINCELVIRKGCVFKTWTVEYYSERSIKYLHHVQNRDLARAVAEMLQWLNENKYITL